VHVIDPLATLSDPWSFWHPTVRSLSATITKRMREDFFPIYAIEQPTMKVATMPGRLVLRQRGTHIDGTTWHRDKYDFDIPAPSGARPTGGKMDHLGGWSNLDDVPQYFKFVPGSHRLSNDTLERRDPRHIKNLTATFTSQEVIADLDARSVVVEIPPGYYMFIHKHIIHNIIKYTNPHKMYRWMQPFVLCDDPAWTDYLNGGIAYLAKFAQVQSLPATPSGYMWEMYWTSRLKGDFKLLPDVLPQDGEPRSLPSQSLAANLKLIFTEEFIKAYGDESGITPRHMPSLLDMHERMGTPMLPEITDEDLAIHKPSWLFPQKQHHSEEL
jgi:hypothetical protein